jgi:hypothetical protein
MPAVQQAPETLPIPARFQAFSRQTIEKLLMTPLSRDLLAS